MAATVAYSYVRFSRPEQMRGDSLNRQKALSTQYCTEHGLVLDTSLNLKDLGVSAYRGQNAEAGALGAFLKAVDEGRVSSGSILLVESLDRLSRDRVVTALRLFLDILERGITIITLSDGVRYNHNDINPYELIISITIMTRAHEESAMKSQRLRAANKTKREKIRTKKMTAMCPSWMKLSADKSKFIQIPEKVKTVQKIFELSASGMGTYGIITYLDEHDIKPIGRSTCWHQSSLSKILKGREVLGELTSNSADGRKVYKDYYPQIIDIGLFYDVQAGIAERNRKYQGKRVGGGRKGRTVANLFQKLLVCGYSAPDGFSGLRCSSENESIVLTNKSCRARPNAKTYMRCYRSKRSNTSCGLCNQNWRYDHFETSFFTFVYEIDLSSLINDDSKIKKKIEVLEKRMGNASGELKEVERRIALITNASLEGDVLPKVLLQRLNDLETQQSKLAGSVAKYRLELETKRQEYQKSDEVANAIINLFDIMPTLPTEELGQIRQKISNILRSVIDRIEVYACGDIVTVAGIETMSDPYFVVYFKSGVVQQVIPDPESPERLEEMHVYT